jgi:hypothetical protein
MPLHTRAIAVFSLLCFSVSAQTPLILFPSLPPPAELIQYLGLTEVQVTAIRQANDAYQKFVSQKSVRMQQVQQEIAEETAKPALDAMALGLRYLELEGSRRQQTEEEGRTRTAIQALLTTAQKTKVQTLEDAMKLQPLICEAQNSRILTLPSLRWFDTSAFVTTIPTSVYSGCGSGPYYSSGPGPSEP